MHLGEYLKSNKITQEQFLRKMQDTTGKRIPKKEVMMMIYQASDQAVQPNDFYLEEVY